MIIVLVDVVLGVWFTLYAVVVGLWLVTVSSGSSVRELLVVLLFVFLGFGLMLLIAILH